MEEIYKDIIGFNGKYQISNLGNLKSLARLQPFIKKRSLTSCGYYGYCLWLKNEQYTRFQHILMAQYFIPNPLNLPQVNHKDHDRLNNALSNLEWVTHSENAAHYFLGSKRKSSIYLGVHKSKNGFRWKASITIDKKLVNLGSFESEFDAAMRYWNELQDKGIKNKYAIHPLLVRERHLQSLSQGKE